MKKVAIIQKDNTTEKEFAANREKAGLYFATHEPGDFILLDVWAKDFIHKTFKEKLMLLIDVLEEADVVYMTKGWMVDPICRIMYEISRTKKKTVIEEPYDY